ncbi:MAG: cystathionine beta-synthase [Bacteroidetes bacterium MED-G13]|nr:MAG: cystathionine beta-synthase [Bacteroidetes bacterium MED-G13]|tara:strand:- start:28499 stop:29509 length:1011 start_codon:yes stop_codon:yes gene_type:complete
MPASKGVYKNLLELIGDTPLVNIRYLSKNNPGLYLAKLELTNPGQSPKDRIALHIINDAEKKGLLKQGSTIIETTSGNTGFSLAMVSLIKGYKCILAVSSKSSTDKINTLKALGAEVHVCPANVDADDPRSYYEVAKKLNKEIEGSLYVNQYFNDLNAQAHYLTTGREIWEQTSGKITHLVVCSGTGGTISGAAKFLKEKNKNIKIIGVDAYGSVLKKYHETGIFDKNEIYPYKIEGLGKNLIPSVTNFKVIDKFIKVGDEESAKSARDLVKKEGIFGGYTTGACLRAVEKLIEKKEFKKDDVIVMLFPDHGSRYLSKIYNEQWLNEQGFEKIISN